MIESAFSHLADKSVYIFPFLFIVTIVVFIHELGHFVVGRLCGIRILTFSIGFGREIFGFQDRHGTRWRFALVPLGGYVKFFGDADAASTPDSTKISTMTVEERAISFFHKPVWKRALVVAAGPIANFFLAIAIFAGIFCFYGKPLQDQAVVGSVLPSTAAESAGLLPGDRIMSIEGQPVVTFFDVRRLVQSRPAQPSALRIERNGQIVTIEATPIAVDAKGENGRSIVVGSLGIRPVYQRYGALTSLRMGAAASLEVVTRTLSFFGRMITGQERVDELRGTIGIWQITTQVTEESGLIGLVNLIGYISLSIGLLNLFPIPLLDGGHLMFYAYESLRGRPLGERSQEILFRFGLAAILFLMLFAAWNDIGRLAAG